DAINGPRVSAYFAMIAAWTGEKDLAIEQLSAVVQPGVYAPGCTHYGILKTFPFWDPLRGDPRFEKIVASLAPNSGPSPTQGKPGVKKEQLRCCNKPSRGINPYARKAYGNDWCICNVSLRRQFR